MNHIFSVVIELIYDDDNGEYIPPSTREIENRISSSLYGVVQHLGFNKEYSVEAAKGTLTDAFGIE